MRSLLTRIDATLSETSRVANLLGRLEEATLDIVFRGEFVEPKQPINTKKVISQ